MSDLLERAAAEAPKLTAQATHDNDTARQIDARIQALAALPPPE